jgi:hypothetical protein
MTQNFEVAVTLYKCYSRVPSSNLGQATIGHPKQGVPWFTSVHTIKYRNSIRLRLGHLTLHCKSFHVGFTSHFTDKAILCEV